MSIRPPVDWLEDDDPVARRLRDTLSKEADMVRPSDRGLERITEELHGPPAAPGGPHRRRSGPGWVPWVAGLAAAAVVGVIAGAVVIGAGDDPAVPVATPSVTEPTTSPSSPTPSPTSSPTTPTDPPPTPSGTAPPLGSLDQVPVYWVGASRSGLWLYREFRTVPDAGGPVISAVRAMMTLTPQDPDYTTPWRQPSRLEVTQDGDAITVDVSADAFANTQVGSELAARAVQQLVWTATAAAQSPGPVTVLVDGAPADAWGAVHLGEPMTRDVDARAFLWLDTPAEGAQVPAGVVEFTGQADVFEGNVVWEVTDEAGNPVADGFTTAAMGMFVPYSFTATLEPGTYTVSVYSPDVSDGESPEGPRMWEQTRTFTVG